MFINTQNLLTNNTFIYENHYLWTANTHWPMLIGDAITALSFVIIPFILLRLLKKRPDLGFNLVIKCFAAFILVCGLGHLIEVVNFWNPMYLFSAWVKVATGILAVFAVIILSRSLSYALKIPSPAALKLKNGQLEVINKELSEVNENLREMMTIARMGNWEVDLVKSQISWSPIVYDIHEVVQGTEIEMETAINYYHPEHRDLIKEAISRCIEKGESWDLELKLVTANSNTIWVRAIGRPVIINDKVVKFKGLFQDINDSKIKQERIEESERMLLEGQSIGRFGNWKWDMVANDLQWSDELFMIFGQKPQSFGATYEALMSIIHPQDRAKFEQDVQTSIEEKKPHDIIHRIVWPTGEIRYVHERGKAYYDKKGNPVRMAGTTQDVTDLMMTQQELLESSAALKDAEKIAKIGNWKWYLDDDTHLWSEERFRVLGLEPNSVTPSMDLVLKNIHEKDRDTVQSKVKSAIDKRQGYELEYDLQLEDGAIKTVKEIARWKPAVDGLGNGLYIGTIQDITAEHEIRKELVDSLTALKRKNEELNSFAYVASHDLQEPLRVITSYLQIIDSSYKSKLDSEGQTFIDNTVKACIRMKTLINDLLALSRLESKVIRRVSVNCQELVETVCSDLEVSINESNAQVLFEGLPTITADAAQLRQLFQNLIGNAIKFRRKNIPPVVNVQFERKSKTLVEFRVSDNGIGIDAKYFQRIFKIFKRLHTRNEFTGTGIGLAICKKIVTRHGGNLEVSSEPGKGSVFSFTLEI